MASPDPRDASFSGSVNRTNFKDVIAKRSDKVEIDGGRLAPAAPGQKTVLHAGQVLSQITADGPLKGRLVAYAAGGTDGSQTPVGVLEKTTEIDEFSNGTEIGIIKVATLFKDLLVGLDAAAITALDGKPFIEHGVNLIRIRA